MIVPTATTGDKTSFEDVSPLKRSCRKFQQIGNDALVGAFLRIVASLDWKSLGPAFLAVNLPVMSEGQLPEALLLTASAAVILAARVKASALPAARAARVDAVEALPAE